jgi:hypothetical protein
MITNFIRELKKLKYFSRVLVNYSRMNTNEHDDNDAIAATTAIQETLKTLKTEDTGKIFEKAICDA